MFATTHAGLEEVLAAELRGLGAREISVGVRGVGFCGNLELLYRANLWLRTASRVLVEIARFPAEDRHRLYDGVREVDWSRHMSVSQTLAVDAVSSRSKMDHTLFVSRVAKDGVVDWFRDRRGKRPSVDAKTPDLRLNVRLHEDECTLSWDTSGVRLHRRGYRSTVGVPAPLQETLAAGVLLLCGYDGSRRLVDPMCGSGTLLVEAAMIARRIAPGLLGRKFALADHPSFDHALWDQVREGAQAAMREVEDCPISGLDISQDAVRSAAAAARGAGVDDMVRVRKAALEDLAPLEENSMLVTNPPYGERLGEINRLGELYETLGTVLKTRCRGADAHVLTGSKFLSKKIGLKTTRRDVLWNGAIECRLLHYDLY
jgi:putative N6-adenine-specific DNA methylase